MQANSFGGTFFTRLTVLFLFLAASSALNPLRADEPPGALQDCTAAAKAWLVSMDHKQYETSYEAGGELLHQQVSLIKWTGALQAIRENFGTVESRELTNHDYFPEGFSGNSGQFMALEFTTKFSALKVNYTENLMMRRENGTWLTVGYRLSPPPPTSEQLAAQPAVQEDSPQQMEMSSPAPRSGGTPHNNGTGSNVPSGPVPIESTSQPLPR